MADGSSAVPGAAHADAPTLVSPSERAAKGRAAREQTPLQSHADWAPGPGRRDPVSLLAEQNEARVPWLVPIRHARMKVSPFTFLRGSSRIMAADLAGTPTSGLTVQLGGDAHLSNFGAYASPSRELVFDQNDFDETLPGPWEWDVKRLAASFFIAARHLGFKLPTTRKVTAAVSESYRAAMAHYGSVGYLDLWYDHTTAESAADGSARAKRIARFARRAESKTNLEALSKLAEEAGGQYRIRSQPPVLVPLRDLPDDYDPPAVEAAAHEGLERYKRTLSDDRHALLDRYTPLDIALKVVGVGSVGTRCLVMLLQGRDRSDPLFLQLKEASQSVLEEFLAPSVYHNAGQRVVEGQRLIQAQSDILLGWTEGTLERRDFYVRQLRDWKGSPDVENAAPDDLAFYARLCGRTLARGHARSGDAVAIAAYTGKSDAFDAAITAFSETYEAQNRRDYQTFCSAIADGRLPASANPDAL